MMGPNSISFTAPTFENNKSAAKTAMTYGYTPEAGAAKEIFFTRYSSPCSNSAIFR